MTSKRNRDIEEMLRRVERCGISYSDAEALRRISMTLHRWFELGEALLECGTDSGAVERDETTGKTYFRNAWSGKRYPTPDRETGALKRLTAVMARYPSLTPYVQGDPAARRSTSCGPEMCQKDAVPNRTTHAESRSTDPHNPIPERNICPSTADRHSRIETI